MTKRSFLLVCILLLTIPIWALTPEELTEKTREISDKLRCPTCQGLSVKESESSISIAMKDEIAKLLMSGKNEPEILNYFQERYGEWILRDPPIYGLSYSLWLIPAIFIILGGLLIFTLFKKHYKK